MLKGMNELADGEVGAKVMLYEPKVTNKDHFVKLLHIRSFVRSSGSNSNLMSVFHTNNSHHSLYFLKFLYLNLKCDLCLFCMSISDYVTFVYLM
jgi:hypothetical protein